MNRAVFFQCYDLQLSWVFLVKLQIQFSHFDSRLAHRLSLLDKWYILLPFSKSYYQHVLEEHDLSLPQICPFNISNSKGNWKTMSFSYTGAQIYWNLTLCTWQKRSTGLVSKAAMSGEHQHRLPALQAAEGRSGERSISSCTYLWSSTASE